MASEHDSPYPRNIRDGDYVPYREFEALGRRVGYLEQKQIGEALVRLEERQHVQGQQIAEMRQTVASIDASVEAIQKSETQRAGFRLGTKELVLMLGATVAILGTIITAAVAIIQLGH